MTIPQQTITPEGIDKVIRHMSAAGHHHIAAVYEALRETNADLLIIPPGKDRLDLPRRRKGRGIIAMVCDDYERAEGPAGFPLKALRKLARKANAWGVMVGGGVAISYATVADFAADGGVAVIIETQTTEEAEWTNFMIRHGRRQAFKILVSPSIRQAA